MFIKIFFIVFICSINAAKLPDTIKRCKHDSPDINACLRVNVKDALNKMKDGIKSLGITPIDPMKIAGFEIGGGQGPVNLKQSFKDLTLTGLVDNEISKYDVDFEKKQLYSEAKSPMLQLVGDYVMNGRILVLPVQGQGKCNLTMFNVNSKHLLQFEPFEKKGKQYWRMTNYKLTLEPELVVTRFDNLFNGDKLLGETTNNFMNENWKDIFAELRPGYEETFEIIFKDIANRIFTKVPLNEIFVE